MKRQIVVEQAYDCIINPCKFEKKCSPANSHGRHNEEWTYVVSDGEAAVSLAVGSGFNLREGPRDKVRPMFMHLHLAWPMMEEEIRMGKSRPCDYIDAGNCFDGGFWNLFADQFYKEHGRPLPANKEDQPESFWVALETFLREKRTEAEDARTLMRCRHCDGRGIVRSV